MQADAYRSLLDEALIPILVTGRETGLVYANARAAALTGYHESELSGLPVGNLIHRDEHERFGELLANSPPGPTVARTVATLLTPKGGPLRPVEITILETRWHGRPAELLLLRETPGPAEEFWLLRQAEENFRFLAEHSNDGILVATGPGNHIYVNQRLSEMTGYSVEELQGMNFTQLLFPEDVPIVRKRHLDRMAGRPAPKRYEVKARRKDGQAFQVEITAGPKVWSGQLADVVIVRDVSDRKRTEAILLQEQDFNERLRREIAERRRAEAALRQSEKRLRVLAEATTDYIWEWDAEGRTIYVSDRITDILGYSPSELLGRTVFELMPHEEAERMRALFAAAVAARQGFRDVDQRVLTRSGKEIWIRRSGVPILSENGELLGYRGTGSDVTEHKLAEDKLRRSEERFRDLVESQRDLIVRVDMEGRFTIVNEAYCRTFGKSRDELLGQSYLPLVHPDDVAHTLEAVKSLEHPPHRIQVEQRALTAAGWRWFSWEDYAIRDGGGRIVEIQAVGRDITEAKRIEEATRRHEAALEAMSFAAEQFLRSSDWNECIEPVLKRLGQSVRTTRAFFWQVLSDSAGQPYVSGPHEWRDPSAHPDPVASPQETIPLSALGTGAWVQVLQRGQPIHEPGCAIPDRMRRFLQARGIYSFLAVPILVKGRIYGILGFSEGTPGREWSPVEVEALRVVGDIMGALVRRQDVVEALRASEAKYRTLVEGTNQPVAMVDWKGVFRYANGQACADLGLTPEEVIGGTMWDVFPKEDADQQMLSVRTVLDSGEPMVRQKLTPVGKRTRWYEVRLVPLRGPSGSFEYVLILANDITESKETEARILSYQQHLRSLTSELALTEQRERRRIASELHDRIGQALALSKIKLGGLQQAALNPQVEAGLEEVRRMIDQTVQDTRSLTFELSPPILYELGFESAVEWLAETTQSRHGIPTRCEDDGRPKPMGADLSIMLFRAVQELLLNAAKHAKARRVGISLRREGDEICVRVEDDGVGFDPDQAGSAAQRVTGFGLFSIRERLGYVGGSVEVESAPGRGTRILMRAPLQVENPGGEEPET